MRISVQESSSRSPFLSLESCFGVSVVQVKHSLQEEALHSHQARGIFVRQGKCNPPPMWEEKVGTWST